MTATLYDLTAEASRLARQIDDAAAALFSDSPEEVDAATAILESLLADEASNRQALHAKADAWCFAIDTIVARGEARAAKAEALERLAKADLQQAEALKERLIHALVALDPDATRFDLTHHKLSSRRSEVVDIDADIDAVDLPEEFQRSRTTITPDKTALKDALKAGRAVAGVQLLTRRSWTIK